jgi:MFS family permease
VFFTLPILGIKNVFLISFIPGILAVLAIFFLTKEISQRSRKQQSMGFWKDIVSLPKSFHFFLLAMFVFGLGNFNRTLLLLRAQQVLTPLTGLAIAGSFSILLYAFRNIIQAISDYFLGRLSDTFSRKILLSFFGFFIFGVMSLGLAFPVPKLWFFILLFFLSGISAAASTALEKAYAADLLPSPLRGTGYGVLQTIDGLGDFLSSFLVGFLWSAISPTFAFVFAALLSFGSATLLFIQS